MRAARANRINYISPEELSLSHLLDNSGHSGEDSVQGRLEDILQCRSHVILYLVCVGHHGGLDGVSDRVEEVGRVVPDWGQNVPGRRERLVNNISTRTLLSGERIGRFTRNSV